MEAAALEATAATGQERVAAGAQARRARLQHRLGRPTRSRLEAAARAVLPTVAPVGPIACSPPSLALEAVEEGVARRLKTQRTMLEKAEAQAADLPVALWEPGQRTKATTAGPAPLLARRAAVVLAALAAAPPHRLEATVVLACPATSPGQASLGLAVEAAVGSLAALTALHPAEVAQPVTKRMARPAAQTLVEVAVALGRARLPETVEQAAPASSYSAHRRPPHLPPAVQR
ncbi:MAG: hypothetical protein EBR82_80770 [Caulobacteraceae bacterium]|nr:hypothetical protein [Caulobacteraceae bacterium]